jgi:Fe-S cluster biogenesis protein NfuA
MELTRQENHPLTDRVNAALNGVRPWLQADGGDVRIHEITDTNEVFIELLGNCVSCRMSGMTLKAGVEDSIRREVPEITAVKAINATLE